MHLFLAWRESNQPGNKSKSVLLIQNLIQLFIRAMRGGCGHFMCHKRCIGTADLFWPQVSCMYKTSLNFIFNKMSFISIDLETTRLKNFIFNSNNFRLLEVPFFTLSYKEIQVDVCDWFEWFVKVSYFFCFFIKDERALFKVLEPLLSRLSHSSWEALDRNVLWNCKRPVWFQVEFYHLTFSWLPTFQKCNYCFNLEPGWPFGAIFHPSNRWSNGRCRGWKNLDFKSRSRGDFQVGCKPRRLGSSHSKIFLLCNLILLILL